MAAKLDQNSRYLKISNLAKDFGIKSKDIVDLLARNGYPNRSVSATISIDEFEAIVNSMTAANQITDMNAYLDGRTYIRKKNTETASAPEAAPVKTEVKVAETKPEVKDEKKEEPKKAEFSKQPQQIHNDRKNNESRPGTQNTNAPKPQNTNQNTHNTQNNNQNNQNNKNNQNRTPAPSTPSYQQNQKKDRFSNVNPLDRNQQDKRDVKKDAPKPEAPKKQTVVVTGTSSDSMSQSNNNGHRLGTRIVDTRSDSVDLSKYDEKLDTFVASEGGYDNQPQKSRGKQNQKPFQKQGQNLKQDQGNNQKNPFVKGGKKPEPQKKQPPVKQQVNVSIPEEIAVGELASRLKVTAAEVIKRLMLLGTMASVNQIIDFDTAEYIATELGAIVTKEVVVTIEEKLFDDSVDKEEDLKERAPVVCVMGHVDHGKTSLLDRIRHTSVTAGEAGGITQHIGAYRVNISGKDITFLDTPGHEAFTAMRARGAKATDIAILVVAADDGIKPQTVEAINHAKAAELDIIVAINKMDKPGASPDNVLQGLTKYDLVPEEWGGDVPCVPVSALTGYGIEDLLENVLVIAELKQLTANPDRRAKGIIIESRLDKGKGPVATVLVQNGTLRTGDIVIAGTSVGRVRSMNDENGRTVKIAGPSVPVEITGLSEVPNAGDEFNAVEDERMARELADQRKEKTRQDIFNANAKVSLDDLFNQINEGRKELNIIVKADVDGSAEAVKASLVKISNEEVKVNVIHAAVGGITESDVMLADASNAIIVGFNVRPDKNAMDSAERNDVDVRTYRVIYECLDEINAAIKGMLAPVYKEQVLGHAQVRQTIRVPNVGVIAGSYVQDGKITRNSSIRVVRQGIVVFEDKIESLRRFKDDVKEVAQGYECGIGLEKFNDIKIDDILEAYEMVQVEQK